MTLGRRISANCSRVPVRQPNDTIGFTLPVEKPDDQSRLGPKRTIPRDQFTSIVLAKFPRYREYYLNKREGMMPYKKAWLFVWGLLALTFVAFWPSYLSQLSGALLAHHAHAASAVLWTVLAAMQAWSIHHDRWSLHRAAGLSVFALFPFFLIAGMWVIHVEATTLARGLNDPENVAIAQFGFFDPLANIGFAVMFWGGLAYRHKLQLHSRYMLGTVMFVVAPVFWRLLVGYVPGFGDDEVAFDYPFAIGNLGAFAIAIALYWQAPKHGRPFLIVAGIIAAQAILYLTVGRLPDWAPIFASVAEMDLPLFLALAGVVSIAIIWHGWVAGSRPKVDKQAVPGV